MAGGKRKRNTPSDKPKKPPTSYLIFCSRKREEVKESVKGEHDSGQKTTTLLSQMWQNLPEEERKMYEKWANVEKIRHQKELAVYYETHPLSSSSEDERKKKKKKSTRKPAASAYVIFGRNVRSQIRTTHPNASFADIGRIIGERWRALTDAERKPYHQQAAEDKHRVGLELAEDERRERTLASSFASHPSSSTAANQHWQDRPSSTNDNEDEDDDEISSSSDDTHDHRGQPQQQNEDDDDDDEEEDGGEQSKSESENQPTT